MTAFDLQESMRRAEQRFGREVGSRRPRRDRGRSRLPAELQSKLGELLQGQERPPVRMILKRLEDYCSDSGFDVPARATVYQAMARAPARKYRVQELPAAVQESLYNLSKDGSVPGHQLAFHCLNYGSIAAVSFAAGLPWLALYQAARLPGWRQRSRGLLGAILKVRRI
jgi:hypothetical protein